MRLIAAIFLAVVFMASLSLGAILLVPCATGEMFGCAATDYSHVALAATVNIGSIICAIVLYRKSKAYADGVQLRGPEGHHAEIPARGGDLAPGAPSPEQEVVEKTAPSPRVSRGFIGYLVVAVAFALAASTAIIKLADLVRGQPPTKGNLGALKGALAVYYGEADGTYPVDDLSSLTVGGRYLHNIPVAYGHPYHAKSIVVHVGKAPDDTGGWMYDNIRSDTAWGSIWVNCTHTDSKGTRWDSY